MIIHTQLLANAGPGALESLAGWERIGARFEYACTLLLLDDRAADGRARLAALGCEPPALPGSKARKAPA